MTTVWEHRGGDGGIVHERARPATAGRHAVPLRETYIGVCGLPGFATDAKFAALVAAKLDWADWRCEIGLDHLHGEDFLRGTDLIRAIGARDMILGR
jgi:hypothetical protein